MQRIMRSFLERWIKKSAYKLGPRDNLKVVISFFEHNKYIILCVSILTIYRVQRHVAVATLIKR